MHVSLICIVSIKWSSQCDFHIHAVVTKTHISASVVTPAWCCFHHSPPPLPPLSAGFIWRTCLTLHCPSRDTEKKHISSFFCFGKSEANVSVADKSTSDSENIQRKAKDRWSESKSSNFFLSFDFWCTKESNELKNNEVTVRDFDNNPLQITVVYNMRSCYPFYL